MSRLKWVWRTATWAILVTALGALVVVDVVPLLGGATAYTVLTGSMAPEMPPGTLVVAKPIGPDEIGVGTVITYQLTSGQPTVVTHRVVSEGFSAEGEPIFQTQGDANNVPDEAWVRPVQIRGAVWYAVPYLGYLSNVLTQREREAAVDVVAALLLAYALVLLGSGLSERRSATVEEVQHA